MESTFLFTKEQFEELFEAITKNKDGKNQTIFNKELGNIAVGIHKRSNGMIELHIRTNEWHMKVLEANTWVFPKSKKEEETKNS